MGRGQQLAKTDPHRGQVPTCDWVHPESGTFLGEELGVSPQPNIVEVHIQFRMKQKGHVTEITSI